MRNIFLSFILLCSNFYNVETVTKIEKIEYISNNYVGGDFSLDIEIFAPVKDIVELKVYFYNKNKELVSDNYYSDSLIIKGHKKTVAKIKYDIEEMMLLNVVVYSDNKKDIIENIMFPVYEREYLTCDLNLEKICISNYPSKTAYMNKKIIEEWEKISLINQNLVIESFDNLVPIDKIHLISNLDVFEAESKMVLKQKIEGMNLFYDDGYIFNLLIENDEIINLKFMDKYCLDLLNGKTYEGYKENCVYSKNIVLPYINNVYEFIVEIKNGFVSFSNVIFRFKVITEGGLIGKCNDSKYCVRRQYL